MKKLTITAICLVLALLPACGANAPGEEPEPTTTAATTPVTTTEPTTTVPTTTTAPVTQPVFAQGPWQNAYAEFLKKPEKYAEDGHHAFGVYLADLDNNGVPEMILCYGNGVEGGTIFANVYLYDDEVIRIGRRIDMYYSSLYFSIDSKFPGIFVEGGRNSTFSCSYWTVKNYNFVREPLWTDAVNFDLDYPKMEYKELSSNKKLIAKAKKTKSQDEVKLYYINETEIQRVLGG